MKYIVLINTREGESGVLWRQLYNTCEQAKDALAAWLNADWKEPYDDVYKLNNWDLAHGIARDEESFYTVMSVEEYNTDYLLKYRFITISNDHTKVRDESIDCYSCSEITIGKAVFLTAPPRDNGFLRGINTSPIVSFDRIKPNLTEIVTESGSKYQILNLQ